MTGLKYRRIRDDISLSRLEERRGWLGREWNSPEDPPPAADRDGHSDLPLDLMDETSCPGCGAGEHESCRCSWGLAA